MPGGTVAQPGQFGFSGWGAKSPEGKNSTPPDPGLALSIGACGEETRCFQMLSGSKQPEGRGDMEKQGPHFGPARGHRPQ